MQKVVFPLFFGLNSCSLMEVQEYLDKMKEIQDSLLEYIDDEVINQEKFNNLINLIKDLKIQDDKYLLKTLLYLLSSIVDCHFRTIYFFDKIFKVILILKDHIKKHFTNIEIFNFFKNPKILLFLFQEKILNIDKTIVSIIIKSKYQITDSGIYLFPEIKQFLDSDIIENMDIPNNLEKHREIEYYDYPILQLIQKDLIDEFITQTSKSNFKLDEEIKISSVFKTNTLL